MKKILFLHGFFASGQCVPALTLKEAFEGLVEVITPDLPMRPKEAVCFIRELIDREKPDGLVGNSCGSFYAQMIVPIVGLPALLGNPHFRMTEFLKQRIGAHQYKSPRLDGKQNFVIDEQLITEFSEMEAHQFDCYSPYYKDKVIGLFGEQDTLAHFEPLFRQFYDYAFHFPGGHTPTADEVRNCYVPVIEQFLLPDAEQNGMTRYFRHFKGGKYRFIRTAFDSETLERMVIYQAMYGEEKYWVRPEKMFFEVIEREGKRFNRFTEIDLAEAVIP
ncbi:MAG: DUF1653 domain-containing protein [Bacteroidaceae bacterium]|nr:DUF1653 domain-containing protein [Bacteroidaceae bacterium]